MSKLNPKLDKKKKIQIAIAGSILTVLLIIIFSLNTSSENQNIETATNTNISTQTEQKVIGNTVQNQISIKSALKTNNSMLEQQQKALNQELLSLTETYKNLAENVKTESNEIKPAAHYTPPLPRKTPTPIKSTSPLDRQASQSAVFFPGGAPRPVSTSTNSKYSKGSNSSSPNSTDSSDTNGDAKEDNTDNADSSDNSTNDSDISNLNNNSANSYNNGGGGYIPIPPPIPPALMTLQYSPSGDYDFVYNENSAGVNPLDEISQTLTLTITIINPTDSFTTIAFCNSQFAACLDSLELSSSSLTINTGNVAKIKPTITNSSYTSTSITIDSTSTTYMVPKLYFLLSNSGTTQVQASAPFPVTSDCTANNAGNIATCTVTNSSSATMNITVNGTIDSSS